MEGMEAFDWNKSIEKPHGMSSALSASECVDMLNNFAGVYWCGSERIRIIRARSDGVGPNIDKA